MVKQPAVATSFRLILPLHEMRQEDRQTVDQFTPLARPYAVQLLDQMRHIQVVEPPLPQEARLALGPFGKILVIERCHGFPRTLRVERSLHPYAID
jgi:hypothetical protein